MIDLFISIFDDKKYVEVYQSKDAEKLGLGCNEKIALAMLLGGDYTEGTILRECNGIAQLSGFQNTESIRLTKCGFAFSCS